MKAIGSTERKAALTGMLTGIGVQWMVAVISTGVFALLIHMELIGIELSYLCAIISIAISSWTGCSIGCIKVKKYPVVVGAGISAGFLLIAFVLHAIIFSESTGNVLMWMIIQLISAAGACLVSARRKKFRTGRRKMQYR